MSSFPTGEEGIFQQCSAGDGVGDGDYQPAMPAAAPRSPLPTVFCGHGQSWWRWGFAAGKPEAGAGSTPMGQAVCDPNFHVHLGTQLP